MASEPSRATSLASTQSQRFAWLACAFGVGIIGGFVLALWAIVNGKAPDVAASPFHIPFYLALAALVAWSAARVVRGWLVGAGWRHAFPRGYGILGLGAATAVLALVLDVGWRQGVGFRFGIEEGFAPSRVVVASAMAMIAIVPLRAALVLGPRRVPRLAAVLSASLTLVALAWPGGLHPVDSAWLATDPDLPEPGADVWVMDADGGRQTRLIEAGADRNFGYASWAPDGSRISFTSFGIPAAGTTVTEATVWLADADGSDAGPLTEPDEWRWIPRITPDGAWVLFTQEAPGGPFTDPGPVGPGAAAGPQGPLDIPLPQADIWRLAASGQGEPERLTDTAGDDRAPVPSPDGTRILFDSTRDGNTELYVMDADGSNARRLTADAGEDWGGSWSPDGSRIAFNSDRTGAMEIYVMNADGSGVRQVTVAGGINTAPSWSPDGRRLAFTSQDADGFDQVWSVAADGADLRNLSRSPTTQDLMWTGGWGSDGRIVFTRALAPVPEATPLVRMDLGLATTILSVMVMMAVVVLLARIDPLPGSFTLALTLAVTLIAAAADGWRFVPAGLAAGLAADLAAWVARPALRGRVTAAASGAAFVLALGAVAVATTGLEWTPSLLLGAALACAAIGWCLGALAEGPMTAQVEPP